MGEVRFNEIDKKWQKVWDETKIYQTTVDTSKPKYYILDMFPYPSGAGIHVGHPLGYTATDILSRFKRLSGFNVLHPMGFDSFGLPAEQYALQTGQHPAKTTEENITRYIAQLKQIGFDYDWDRAIRTSDPDYYKWTQWIFGLLFKHYFNTVESKAKPIEELIDYLKINGTLNVPAFGEVTIQLLPNEWDSLTSAKKEEVLQQFRLAFRAQTVVNWCPALGTVLANEEVKDGVSERGGYPVEKKTMWQWSLRITAYADRLIDGLTNLDWPEAVKEMQKNWIGKSQGASLFFPIKGSEEQIEVFTTRVDTTFGVTFLSIAPEHELAERLLTDEQKEAGLQYINTAKNRSERDRMSDVKTISGVFTGSYCINPFNGAEVPIWIADYVLGGYGTGAVMAVPSSDTRDYAFAKHFNLPIILVQEGERTDISKPDFEPKAGTMINSGFLNGLPVKEAITKAVEFVEEKGLGKGKTNYRLRNAIFSRQRYWGEPFPIYFDAENVPQLIEVDELPITLPNVDAYKPTESGEPPLARAENFVYNSFPMETNTMPGWAGSSWYYARYVDPKNNKEFANKESLSYWQNVDFYMGGAEHATGHLLYSRFWGHFLNDLGHLPFAEPFKKLYNQGMIQGVSEKAKLCLLPEGAENRYHFMSAELEPEDISALIGTNYQLIEVFADIKLVKGNKLSLRDFINWRPEYAEAVFYNKQGKVSAQEAGFETFMFLTTSEVEKMSKSKYNVVNPDEIISEYGADTFRLYEMFLGPLDQSKPWNTNGIEGTYKFLRKVWKLYFDEEGKSKVNDAKPSEDSLKILHKTIKKVSEDIEKLSFNTCVSTLMICANELTSQKCTSKDVMVPLAIILAPFAPHIAEELWQSLGNQSSINLATWPTYEEKYIVDSTFNCPISINGKVRVSLTLPKGLQSSEVEKIALENPVVVKWLDGKLPKKLIVVQDKIVNIVI